MNSGIITIILHSIQYENAANVQIAQQGYTSHCVAFPEISEILYSYHKGITC